MVSSPLAGPKKAIRSFSVMVPSIRTKLRLLTGGSGIVNTRTKEPTAAHELAAQVIGVNSFELPGEPSGVEREIIGQLPSGFCVATRKSIPRLISGRSAVKPASDNTYKV